MTTWRPRPAVRVIAIGLAWCDGRLLVAEVRDDAGRLVGHRPLGGGVAFGERWRDALIREFREEVGVAVTIRGDPTVLENLFRHEGAVGHEIVFAADVMLPPDALPGPGPHRLHENDGTPFAARWVDPAALDAPLLPEGLAAALDARARGR